MSVSNAAFSAVFIGNNYGYFCLNGTIATFSQGWIFSLAGIKVGKVHISGLGRTGSTRLDPFSQAVAVVVVFTQAAAATPLAGKHDAGPDKKEGVFRRMM